MKSLADSGTSPEQLHATKAALVTSICAKIEMLGALDFEGAARLTNEIARIPDSIEKQPLTNAVVTRLPRILDDESHTRAFERTAI